MVIAILVLILGVFLADVFIIYRLFDEARRDGKVKTELINEIKDTKFRILKRFSDARRQSNIDVPDVERRDDATLYKEELSELREKENG